MARIENTLTAGRPSARAEKQTLLMLNDETKKRITFETTEETYYKLKEYALKKRVSLKECLTELVNNLPG